MRRKRRRGREGVGGEEGERKNEEEMGDEKGGQKLCLGRWLRRGGEGDLQGTLE